MGHPAWVALLERSTRRSSGDPGDATVLAAAMRLRLAVELTEADSSADGPDDAERQAEDRIFESPMRDLHDEEHPGVHALTREGRRVAPVFQFDSEGHVRSDVAEVNQSSMPTTTPGGRPRSPCPLPPCTGFLRRDLARPASVVIAAAVAVGTGE